MPPVLSSKRSYDTGRSAVIQRQSHSTIFVTDQQEALEFYRDKLGFEVRTDMPMTDEGDIRWLTLSPKGQPDLEIILAPLTPGPMFDAEQAKQIKRLVQSGALGIGVFQTDDINSDYERLSTQGVEFVSPPEEKFYGIEAIVKDNSGNWFSLTQPKG
jgi:catechol 2,3-dioxygenase-like lactoylglutathione lyase family enzyme